VTVALHVAGRLHTPDYTFGLFGRTGLGAIAFKSVLASVALGLAVLQVLLALWIYRKLPLADGPPPQRDPQRRSTPQRRMCSSDPRTGASIVSTA
jgi:hypothetical protein